MTTLENNLNKTKKGATPFKNTHDTQKDNHATQNGKQDITEQNTRKDKGIKT